MNSITNRTSKLILFLIAVVFWDAVVIGDAQAIDRVRRSSGTDSGKITSVSPLTVTLSKGGVENKIPVEDIRSIDFSGEPEDLRPARIAAAAGRFEDAITRLEEINRTKVEREEILQDIDYLAAACRVELALAGKGNLKSAARKMESFLSKNRNSYRVTAGIALLGHALQEQEDFSGARQQYEKLAKAPSPYFRARSAFLIGKLLQQQGKHEEALSKFDEAIAAAQKSPAAESEVLQATLHRAISLSATGKLEEATKTVKEIIARADPSETNLLAAGYNALGDCYLQAGNEKGARDAFLHVDVLFSKATTEHAKALYELSKIWSSLGQQSRAKDAGERLKKQYPASRWATK